MSDLQENEEKKDGVYAKRMQEKEQEMMKIKRDILLSNEHVLKQETETEELRNEFHCL